MKGGLKSVEEKFGLKRAESVEDLTAWLRSTCEHIYHPVGTCRMGSDAGAVLDPELRVRGVEGLRVADCSVMPSVQQIIALGAVANAWASSRMASARSHREVSPSASTDNSQSMSSAGAPISSRKPS